MKKIGTLGYFGIFLIPLVMNPFGFQAFGIVKVCFFLVVLGVVLGWMGVRIFRGKGLAFRVNKWVLTFLFVWVLSFFLSVVFSLNPAQSFFGEYFYLQGALFYLFVAVHFLICWKIFSEKGRSEMFLNLVKWVGLAVSTYAIIQYFYLDPEYVGRVFGTVGQPNFLAQFLIFPLFVALFERSRWLKWLFLGVILLAILMTGSRAVILGVVVSLFLWFLFYGRIARFYKAVFSVVLVAVVVGGLLLLDFDLRSVNSRLFLWGSMGDLINLKDFVFGSGVETFSRRFVEVMPAGVFDYENFFATPRNMHNEILHSFVERGAIGMILCLIPVGFLVWSLFWKKVKDVGLQMVGFALLAYIISVQFSFSTVTHFVFLAAFWAVFLLGVLKNDYRLKLKNVFIGILLVCVSVLILFSSFFLMKSDLLLKKGVDMYVVDVNESGVLIEDAADSAFFFAYPYKLIVDFFGNEESLDEYGKITGFDFNYNILAMKVAWGRENFNEIEYYYQKGVEDSPNLPVFYVTAGDIYFLSGDCKSAVEAYEILEFLAPDYEKDSDEYRLFIKHASAFGWAMDNLDVCREIISEN